MICVLFKNIQEKFIKGAIKNYSRIDPCIKSEPNSLPCPFDGRILFGTNHFDKDVKCESYCLKEVLDFLPDLRDRVLKCGLSFKKHGKRIERILSKEEEKQIIEKIKEKSEYFQEEAETEKTRELKSNLVCIYGNEQQCFPKQLLDCLLDILPDNMYVVENKTNKIFTIWKDSQYIMRFSLKDVSVGISFYENKIWCYITKGDNISLTQNKSCIMFEEKFNKHIYNEAKEYSKKYSIPAKTETYELLTKNSSIDNLICSNCSLKSVCFGNCAYKKIANTLMEGALYGTK